MPALFVGLHLALISLTALFGLSFIADPCGGGGDLCLGGTLGLFALGTAGVGLIGIAVWSFGRRASPLLLWDAALLAIAGFFVLYSASYAQPLVALGALLATLLGLAGCVLAGRAVATHRLERLLVIAILVGLAVLLREVGVVILVIVVLALAVGWRLAREDVGQVASAADAPFES